MRKKVRKSGKKNELPKVVYAIRRGLGGDSWMSVEDTAEALLRGEDGIKTIGEYHLVRVARVRAATVVEDA